MNASWTAADPSVSTAKERFSAQNTTIKKRTQELFEAIDRGDHGQAWHLIREGVSLRETDESTGLSPLAFAVQLHRTEIVRMLVEAGADANWGGTTTPLEAAALEGEPEITEILIEAGADVDRRVDEGFTPLMTAAALGHRRVCQKLLLAGARPLLRNDHGQTAVGLAVDNGHEGTAELIRGFERKRRATERHGDAAVGTRLREHGYTLPRPLAFPGARTRGDAPHPSASIPATISAPPRTFGATDLRTLLQANNTDDARRLVERLQFDPSLRDAEGRTPLIVAAQHGAVEIAALLLMRGADVHASFGEDETALTQAIQHPTRDRSDVIEVLVRAGAELNRRHGPSGSTPLMVAAHTDVYSEATDTGPFGATTQLLIDLGADLEAQDNRSNTVWRLIKRAAMGAPTFSPYRRRLYQMLRLLEQAGAQQLASHQV